MDGYMSPPGIEDNTVYYISTTTADKGLYITDNNDPMSWLAGNHSVSAKPPASDEAGRKFQQWRLNSAGGGTRGEPVVTMTNIGSGNSMWYTPTPGYQIVTFKYTPGQNATWAFEAKQDKSYNSYFLIWTDGDDSELCLSLDPQDPYTPGSTLTTANSDNNPPQCWWMVWIPMPPSESPAEQTADNADMKRQMKAQEDLERAMRMQPPSS